MDTLYVVYYYHHLNHDIIDRIGMSITQNLVSKANETETKASNKNNLNFKQLSYILVRFSPPSMTAEYNAIVERMYMRVHPDPGLELELCFGSGDQMKVFVFDSKEHFNLKQIANRQKWRWTWRT